MSEAPLDALQDSLRAAFHADQEVVIDDPSPLQREALARAVAEPSRDGWRFDTRVEPGRYRVLGRRPPAAP